MKELENEVKPQPERIGVRVETKMEIESERKKVEHEKM